MTLGIYQHESCSYLNVYYILESWTSINDSSHSIMQPLDSTVMASLPTNLCELFAQSVRQYPENLAVEHEDGSFTYKELDDTSSALAHDLKLLRVGRGSLVLLVTTHGSFNIIAILAILKAGGCFVPIDRKTWSPEMINYVCDKVESHIIINTTPEPFSAAKGSHHVLHLTSLPTISSSQISPSVYPQTLEDDDACIIFTSGSTGCPKGVILSHKSLCLYSTTSPMNLDIVPGDRLLHILSVAFDGKHYFLSYFYPLYNSANTIFQPALVCFSQP